MSESGLKKSVCFYLTITVSHAYPYEGDQGIRFEPIDRREKNVNDGKKEGSENSRTGKIIAFNKLILPFQI